MFFYLTVNRSSWAPEERSARTAPAFPKYLKFDIAQVMKTSRLVNGFDEPLASLDLIQIAIEGQLTNVINTATNLLNPTDLLDNVDQGTTAVELTSVASPSPSISPTPTPTPTPTGTPGKFGRPTVIAADPYIIDQNTTIQTDPSITKNGVTDFGKIYRGEAVDGPASAYLFGMTSAFDTMSGFDDDIGVGGDSTGGAVFEFTSLQLIGDPTISTTNGQINLGLIGINGITSGGSGATLTFAGIRGLLLATENGSINIGAEISFTSLHDLIFYARGAGSSLTLACSISTMNELHLYSEGAVNLSGAISTGEFMSFSGGDFNLTGGSIGADTISIISGANVNFSLGAPVAFATTDFLLQAAGNFQASDSLDVTQVSFGQTDGLNISLAAGGNMSIGGDLSLTTDASDIQNGGNILVTSGGNMTVAGAFQLLVLANSDSTTGTGGNITVSSGGSLTSGSLDFDLDFNNSVGVTNGVNLTLNVVGNLTTTSGGVNLILFTPIGNTLGSGGNLSMSVGGDLTTFDGSDVTLDVVNTVSTTVPNGANLFASIGGDLNAGAVFATIENDSSGGIGTGGNLTLNVGGDLNASDLLAQISNTDFGNITTGGNIAFHVDGDLNKSGSATFFILNYSSGHIGTGGNIIATVDGDVNGGAGFGQGAIGFALNATIDNSAGGFIGTGGTITLNIGGAVNVGALTLLLDNSAGGHIGTGGNILVSTGGDLAAGTLTLLLNNRDGGTLGGDSLVSLSTGGAITTTGDATLVISDRDDGGGAGTIGGNASVILTAASANIGGNLVVASPSEAVGGQIASALVTVNVAGDISTGGGLQFTAQNGGFNQILGMEEGGGIINQDALVSVSAANVTIGDFLLGLISNVDGGQIGGNAALATILTGDLNAQGDAAFQIDNSTMMGTLTSTIGSDAAIGVTANNLTAGSLEAQIFNQGGSSIGGNATINFAVAGAITSQTHANFQIFNEDDDNGFGPGTIGSGASVTITANSLSAASLHAEIDNTGGTIGGAAAIDMNVSGNVTVANDATVAIYGSDGAASAAINFNGGSYNAGGTFLSYIDGNGTMTFNNASAHADVLKAGVFGPNGVLNVGGGTLSGDTTLKLYAPGSNGMINFVSNVTLDSNSSVIIAANTVTINNGVVVTITGDDGIRASVFTNVPNYTGSGGNGTTSGTFAGNLANTQPLGQAPPFGNPPRPTAPGASGGRRTGGGFNVTSTQQLLAMLDDAVPDRRGRITIPASRTTTGLRNSGQINAADRLSLSAGRRAVDSRAASSLTTKRLVP